VDHIYCRQIARSFLLRLCESQGMFHLGQLCQNSETEFCKPTYCHQPVFSDKARCFSQSECALHGKFIIDRISGMGCCIMLAFLIQYFLVELLSFLTRFAFFSSQCKFASFRINFMDSVKRTRTFHGSCAIQTFTIITIFRIISMRDS